MTLDNKLKKILKRDTIIIAISVIFLTTTVIRTTYAYVFSVQSKSTLQQLSSGTLNLTINKTQSGSHAMSTNELYPVDTTLLPTTANSVYTGDFAKLTLDNLGTVPSHFLVNIGYDALPTGSTQSDLISFNYLMIGVFSEDDNAWLNLGTTSSPAYYKTISSLSPSSTNVYDVFESEIAVSGTKNYRIYIWLDENTPISEIEKLVYLKVNVLSTTVNGRV